MMKLRVALAAAALLSSLSGGGFAAVEEWKPFTVNSVDGGKTTQMAVEPGLKNKFKAAAEKGIPTIAFINPVAEAPVTSKIFVDFKTKGRQTGEFLKKSLGASGGKVVAFPGPQGSGWAESYLVGFKEALASSKVQLLDTKFGDAGVAEQIRLVEDSLQSYPDMTAIGGTAPTAEAAIGAVADAGRKGVAIVASYENQAMLKAMQERKILGFGTEFPVMQARVAVNLAVSALEKRPVPKHLLVVPQMVTNETAKSLDPTMTLALAGFQPVFSVRQSSAHFDGRWPAEA